MAHPQYTRERSLAAFYAKIDKSAGEDGCWLWTAAHLREGYGQARWNGRKVLAHRLAYELAYGPILDGLWVLHKCDNPPCCNPAHLFLGSNADNVADYVNKGRKAVLRGEQGWHKLKDVEVAEIRRLYALGGITQMQLAAQFGVTPPCISRIVRYKSRV